MSNASTVNKALEIVSFLERGNPAEPAEDHEKLEELRGLICDLLEEPPEADVAYHMTEEQGKKIKAARGIILRLMSRQFKRERPWTYSQLAEVEELLRKVVGLQWVHPPVVEERVRKIKVAQRIVKELEEYIGTIFKREVNGGPLAELKQLLVSLENAPDVVRVSSPEEEEWQPGSCSACKHFYWRTSVDGRCREHPTWRVAPNDVCLKMRGAVGPQERHPRRCETCEYYVWLRCHDGGRAEGKCIRTLGKAPHSTIYVLAGDICGAWKEKEPVEQGPMYMPGGEEV